MKIMCGFSEQLGVHCTFCHAEDAATKHPNFASDLKPEKNTARTMMLMTQEINAKYMSQIHDPDAAPIRRRWAAAPAIAGTICPSPSNPQSTLAQGRETWTTPPRPPKP